MPDSRSTPPADLTASVVSHGQAALVNTLIADLVRCACPQLKRLVVTLNLPEEGSLRADGAPFEVLVLRNDVALGFGANHNRAFRHCNTTWFAVLNPDLRLPDHALEAVLAAAEPGDGLLSPLILNADASLADAARRLPTPLQIVARRLRTRADGPDPDFDWLAGMCLLLNSDAFRSLGGFDQRYFMYCEDVDLCLRMQLGGWRLHHVKDVSVVHDARRDSHRSVQYLGWHVASLLRLWTSRAFWSYLLRGSGIGRSRQAHRVGGSMR